jgi:hypothetical protein
VAFPSPGYVLLLSAFRAGPDGRPEAFWMGLIVAGILLPLGAGIYREWAQRERYPDGVVAVVCEAGVHLGWPATRIPWTRVRELVVCRLLDHSGETPALIWFLVVIEHGPPPGAKQDRDPRTWGHSRDLPGRVNIKAITAAVAHHGRANVRYLGTVDNVQAAVVHQ